MSKNAYQMFHRQGTAGMRARLEGCLTPDEQKQVENHKSKAASGYFEDVKSYRELLESLFLKYQKIRNRLASWPRKCK